MAPVISLIIWFAIYLAVVLATGALYRALAREDVVRIVFFPGFVAVWAGRFAACVLTGADADGDRIYRQDADDEEEGKRPKKATRIGLALLPFAVCTAALIGMFVVPDDLPVPVSVSPPDTIELTAAGIFLSVGLAASYSLQVCGAIASDPTRWQLWAAIYASAALIVAGAPRTSDLWYVVPGIGGPLAGAIAVERIGVGAGVFGQARFALWIAGDSLWEALGFVLAMATFTLGASAIVLGGAHLWGRRRARGASA